MKKTICLITICLLTVQLCYSQFYNRASIDSLQHIIQKQENTTHVNTLLHLSEAFYNMHLDSAMAYAKTAYGESKQLSYKWGIHKALYCIAKTGYINRPIDEFAEIPEYCSDWFTQNGYEADAIYCDLLNTNYVLTIYGRTKSKLLAEKVLQRAIKFNNTKLIGYAWMMIAGNPGSKLVDPKYPHALDSAAFYILQSNDSAQIININLALLLSQNGSPLSIKVATDAIKTSRRWGNLRALCEANMRLGLNYAGRRQIDSVALYYSRMQFWNELYGSKSHEQMAFQHLTYAYRVTGSIDKGIEYAHLSLDLCSKMGYRSRQCLLLYELSNLDIKKGLNAKALKTGLKLLELGKNQGDEFWIYSAQKILGRLYVETEEFEKAEVIYQEAIDWVNEGENNPIKLRTRGNLYVSMGILYKKQNDFEQAISYYNLAHTDLIDHDRTSIDPKIEILKMYLDLNDIEHATESYQQIMVGYTERTRNYIIDLDLTEGRYFTAIGDYEKAISKLNTYLERSQAFEFDKNRMLAYQNLYKAYKSVGRPTEALSSYISYQSIKDSISNGVQKKNVQKIQSEYELSLKEATIEDLRQQQELNDLRLIQQDKDLEVRQLYLILLSAFILIIAGVAYLYFRRLKLRKGQLEIKQRAEQAELKLENFQANQKAEIAEIKNVLFANVSHEFRTPLTLIQVPIKNYLHQLPQEDQHIFNGVLNNTEILLKMIDELLNVSQIESGKLELNILQFDLYNFFARIKMYFIPLFNEKNIDLNWNYSLPKVTFLGDETRLKVVVNNILKNAFTHTPEKGMVACEIDEIESYGIRITISNTGTGINQMDLPLIFDRYYRGNEQEYTGNGIGLSIAKEIVEMHKGTIQVQNAEDEVRFIVEIPGELVDLIPADQFESNSAVLELNVEATEEITLKNKRPTILIVEDNPEMRQLLKNSLTKEFNLLLASDGVNGEQIARNKQPDLILSDIMMPKKDGFELLMALKSSINSSHIPVVLLTAKSDEASKISALNHDADDYILKPFNPIELIARIHNILRQRKSLQKRFKNEPFLNLKKLKVADIDAAFFNKARNILDINYVIGSFTVQDFCRELALNRNSVHNKIVAYTSGNTSTYIQNFRLEKAAALLLETDTPIADIYLKTGFNNSQTFNRSFKVRFLLTPSAFRDKERKS